MKGDQIEAAAQCWQPGGAAEPPNARSLWWRVGGVLSEGVGGLCRDRIRFSNANKKWGNSWFSFY